MSRKTTGVVNEDAMAMDIYSKQSEEQTLSVENDDKMFLAGGENYNLHVCIERAKELLSQVRRGLIRLGGQLILLKNHETYGNFTGAVESLGITLNFAERAMVAARQYGENPEAAEKLGNSKMIELSFLTDKEAKDLAAGKHIDGVGTLDEIERMTVRDLRAALRAEKKKRTEERDAQETAISQKEQKLNELEQELRYRQPPTKTDIAQAALDEIQPKVLSSLLNIVNYTNITVQHLDRAARVKDANIDQLTALSGLLAPHLYSLKDAVETLADYIDNPCPIKEEVPCMDDM